MSDQTSERFTDEQLAEWRRVIEIARDSVNDLSNVVKGEYLDWSLAAGSPAGVLKLLDQLDAARAEIATLKLRLEPVGSPNFEALIAELGIDMTDPLEVLAEKIVQQRARIRELEAAAERDRARIAGLELALQDRDSIYQHAGELEIRLNAANNEIAELRGAPGITESEASQTPRDPDAYIAVKRYFAVSADGPEWKENAKVFPAGEEWRVEREEFAAEGGWEFLPIVADGDGTRFAAAQSDPVGYAVTVEDSAGRFVQTSAVMDRAEAEQRAEFYAEIGYSSRVVELREASDA